MIFFPAQQSKGMLGWFTSIVLVKCLTTSILGFYEENVKSLKWTVSREHAQNAHIQIILRMRKVSFLHLFLIYIFSSIQWFC